MKQALIGPILLSLTWGCSDYAEVEVDLCETWVEADSEGDADSSAELLVASIDSGESTYYAAMLSATLDTSAAASPDEDDDDEGEWQVWISFEDGSGSYDGLGISEVTLFRGSVVAGDRAELGAQAILLRDSLRAPVTVSLVERDEEGESFDDSESCALSATELTLDGPRSRTLHCCGSHGVTRLTLKADPVPPG